MRYGLPYKGSKSTIANQLINVMPEAECFVDLFCGGCAMTHAAMLSGKYKRFVINDIDRDMPKLFVDAIHGKYHDERRWISREDFETFKDTDPYVKICWSFGSNGRDYMYARDLEEWKHGFHEAVFNRDLSIWESLGLHDAPLFEDITDTQKRRMAYGRWLKQRKAERREIELERLQSLERLERLERLQSLESLESLERLERLQSYNLDYSAVPIPPDSVIYCDIPYEGTDDYTCPFEHDRFREWALSQTQPIFISSYQMPPPFICVFETVKTQTLAANATNIVTERLYTTPRHKGGAVNIQLDLFGG